MGGAAYKPIGAQGQSVMAWAWRGPRKSAEVSAPATGVCEGRKGVWCAAALQWDYSQARAASGAAWRRGAEHRQVQFSTHRQPAGSSTRLRCSPGRPWSPGLAWPWR